jgi:glycosyltransferase involved in cell wall biosynthesis
MATSTWQSFDPQVSVVVPLYNDGRHVADTVASVTSMGEAASPRTEIVIVDDHSTDGSRELAENQLRDIDWFPATLIARAASGGPAVARNAGFATARGAHVLSLDAGSTVYPTGVRRLFEHLEGAPPEVVAAYGVAERFDTTGSLGLAGHIAWGVEALVRGAFAAPIAMYRRQQLAEIGGWPSPSSGVEDGWDEYDMWLTIAERGLRADLVGSIVGRRREALASLVKMRDVDTASSFVIARERHPRLPWPN